MEWQQWVLEQPRWPAHARQGNSNRRSVGPRHRQDRAGVLDRAVGDDDSRGYARDRHGINRIDAHDAVARRASKMVPAIPRADFLRVDRDRAHFA